MMNSTKEILGLWSQITDFVHGSTYTTDELRNHVSAVLVMLKSHEEFTQRKALRQIISMCHPKCLGDNQIPDIGWKQWTELLAETKLRAQEIETGTTAPEN